MTDAATPELNKHDIRKRRSLLAQTTLRLFGKTGAIVGGIWIVITAILAVFAPFLANSRPLLWKVTDPDLGQGWSSPVLQALTPQDALFLAGFFLILGCLACYRAGGKVFWVWLASMCAVFVGAMIFTLLADHSEMLKQIGADLDRFNKDDSSENQRALHSSRMSLFWWWVRWGIAGLATIGLYVLSIARLRQFVPWLIVALVLSSVMLGILLTPAARITPVAIDAAPDHFYREAIVNGQAEQAIFPLIPYSPNDGLVDQTTINEKSVGVRSVLRSPGLHPRTTDIAREMQSQAENIYGIRLYEITDAQGEQIPIPQTIKQAYAVSDMLYQAYQEKPGYIPTRGRAAEQKAQSILDRLSVIEPKTRLHLMGTTISGRDLTSRMIHGSRIALYIGFISTSIAVVIGIIIGGLLGYFAGWVDLIGLRLVEIFASIPVIMLLIMIVAFYGRSLVLMMVVIGLTGWVGYAYFIRAEFLKLRKMDYVMAARAAGTPLYLILFKHMLPNGVAPVLVGASFGIAGGIMTEAALSFIGLGLEPTEPSWGQMLDQARQGGFYWWLAIYPGLAIFLTVFAYNLIGEALRDVIDPRTAK
jgi:ABC-type dipeptide/oligopeptide/nickel transport system permease subunit